MYTAGIKELKAKLSSYINYAHAGQTIFITDHGEEVALISPLSDEYRLMQILEKSAKAHWSKGKPQGFDKGIELNGKPLS